MAPPEVTSTVLLQRDRNMRRWTERNIARLSGRHSMRPPFRRLQPFPFRSTIRFKEICCCRPREVVKSLKRELNGSVGRLNGFPCHRVRWWLRPSARDVQIEVLTNLRITQSN